MLPLTLSTAASPPSTASTPSSSSSASAAFPESRECMTCLQLLPFHHFTPGQWRMAKTNSQCRACEAELILNEGRHLSRLNKRKWEELVSAQHWDEDDEDGEEGEEEDEEDGPPLNAHPRPPSRPSPSSAVKKKRQRRPTTPYRPSPSPSQGRTERSDRVEVVIDDDDEGEVDVEELQSSRWPAPPSAPVSTSLSNASSPRAVAASPSPLSSPATEDGRVEAEPPTSVKRRRRRRKGGDADGDEVDSDGKRRRRRRRRQRELEAELGAAEGRAHTVEAVSAESGAGPRGEGGVQGAADGDAPVKRRRRRHRKSKRELAEEERRRKLAKIRLAPSLNPYSRVQHSAAPLPSSSRSGRAAPLSQSDLPPPLPLNPDLQSLLRESFGLTLARDLDPSALKASALNPVYSRFMQQTGTLRNGRVYVAVSGLSPTDDLSNDDSDEESALRRTRRLGRRKEEWQPMLGLYAGSDFAEGEVVTCYGGGLLNADAARRRPKTTWTHIRRIRDSQFVKDGRLFSALFDRRQVDMWEQYQMKAHKRKKLPPRVPAGTHRQGDTHHLTPTWPPLHPVLLPLPPHGLPHCSPSPCVGAQVLSSEGHEDEVRVGLLLLDAEARNPAGVSGVDKLSVLQEVMRQIGMTAAIIDGDAMREMGEREAAALLEGGPPALIIHLPSATFTSSSANPYASSSTAPAPFASPSTSLCIAPLFPFPIQELHLPAATLHPLPEVRLTTLQELVQNLHRDARQALQSTCADVTSCVSVGGLGYMANTGTRKEINVRVVEVNPRKDGLLPNEVFYVATRAIRRGEEILAPYNNNESKKKAMRKGQGGPQQSAAHNGEDEEEQPLEEGDGDLAASPSPPRADADGPSPSPVKLSKVQKARLRRIRAMENKREERAKKRAADAAEAAQMQDDSTAVDREDSPSDEQRDEEEGEEADVHSAVQRRRGRPSRGSVQRRGRGRGGRRGGGGAAAAAPDEEDVDEEMMEAADSTAGKGGIPLEIVAACSSSRMSDELPPGTESASSASLLNGSLGGGRLRLSPSPSVSPAPSSVSSASSSSSPAEAAFASPLLPSPSPSPSLPPLKDRDGHSKRLLPPLPLLPPLSLLPPLLSPPSFSFPGDVASGPWKAPHSLSSRPRKRSFQAPGTAAQQQQPPCDARAEGTAVVSNGKKHRATSGEARD